MQARSAKAGLSRALGHEEPARTGSANHSTLGINLTGELYAKLSGKRYRPFNCDFKVRIDLKSQTRFYYPDAMVSCDQIEGDSTYLDNPIVVAEILSPSTRRVDLGEKLEAYLSLPSLRAILLIEPDFPHVTLHRRNSSGEFTIEVFKSLETEIPLPEIDVSLPMTRLYDRITPTKS
ncbi:Uma2 family endonuclease [Roseibacillus persicicus]|uniref:Uma2 family endonuclease n=1 Tax=Roseibacillus persicicus TaxID=454148 RepID=UPI00227D7D30|nr:Uma2 family endonuclease [Roseibacillus persicicus]